MENFRVARRRLRFGMLPAGRQSTNSIDSTILCRPRRAGARKRSLSEKDGKLAQKLGQLLPFIAVLPQECRGQLAYVGAT
jgi:hypothetical protein